MNSEAIQYDELYSKVLKNSLRPNENNNLSEREQRELKKKRYLKKKALIQKGYKKGLITGVMASLIVISSVSLGIKGINNVKEFVNPSYINEFTDQGSKAVNDAYSRGAYSEELGEYYHYYDYSNIAQNLSQSKDFDAALFGTYMSFMNQNDKATALKSMDSVISNLCRNGIVSEKNFYEYCSSRGFIDKKGDIDLKAYQNSLEDYCTALGEYETEKGNISPGKK